LKLLFPAVFTFSAVIIQLNIHHLQFVIPISLGSRKTLVLKKRGDSSDSGIGEDSAENWVNAPEFVPAGKDNIPKTAERGEYSSDQQILFTHS
jgi:hypothetical protein